MIFRPSRYGRTVSTWFLALAMAEACAPAIAPKVDSPGTASARAPSADGTMVGTPRVSEKPDGVAPLTAAGPGQAPAHGARREAPSAGPSSRADARAVSGPPSEGQMAHVAGGTVMIGPEGYKLPVAVAPFEIDVTEVTVAAYDKCLRAKRCDVVQEDDPDSPPGEPPPPNSFARAECNEGNAERLQHPMNCISGPQAAAYCAWIKKRLPTDAEWELAATGPDGRILPWGAIDPAKKPCWDQPNTCPVASHPDDMSPVGVFDMAGNVDEWAVDYRTKRPGTRASEVPSYAALGANWRDVSDDTTIQEYNPSDTLQRDTLGFRCAR